jgi:hypothetical protein
MMAFFFTMPISRMMPISAMTFSSLREHERQQRAHAGRRKRREDRDRVNVTFVEDPQHDVDGHERGQDQIRLVGAAILKGLRRCRKLPRMLAGMPSPAAHLNRFRSPRRPGNAGFQIERNRDRRETVPE